ncbi:MAG: hypothetical protein EXQ94_15100 [Alphaproteobacteria bacterium]|nr:hypothetical protein [Alphaproteobacteria bacterium]
MENQVVGLAERVGLPFVVKRLRARGPWRWLPPDLWPAPLAGLDPPWPRLLIATGRPTVAAALAAGRRGTRTFTVQIQDPRVNPARFGLVVAPAHDGLTGGNVITTVGSLHGITAAKLAAATIDPALAALPRPRIAVLLGGANRAFNFDAGQVRELAGDLARLARAEGGSLLVTPSRRTGDSVIAAFRAALADVPHAWWEGRPPNPYLGYLALADAIVVTADSVNLTSEALATAKPVLVAPMRGGGGKFRRFHSDLEEKGYTRPFRGRLEAWTYTPPDDTGRVAADIRRRLGIAPVAAGGGAG